MLRRATGAGRVVRVCPWCGSSAHGRPLAIDSPAHVSIGYTENLAVVAWSFDGPVGIDVERSGPPVAEFGDRQAWTRIEALLKATGEGLRRDPRDLPDLPTTQLGPPDLPLGYVGTVAGSGVSWRLAGPAAPAAPGGPATP